MTASINPHISILFHNIYCFLCWYRLQSLALVHGMVKLVHTTSFPWLTRAFARTGCQAEGDWPSVYAFRSYSWTACFTPFITLVQERRYVITKNRVLAIHSLYIQPCITHSFFVACRCSADRWERWYHGQSLWYKGGGACIWCIARGSPRSSFLRPTAKLWISTPALKWATWTGDRIGHDWMPSIVIEIGRIDHLFFDGI